MGFEPWSKGLSQLQHKVLVVGNNVNIIPYKNKIWLCDGKCNQNYILKPCIQTSNSKENAHALTY
jgi:hypothetical protein